MGSPLLEPIEFYAHLRFAHRHLTHSLALLTDDELVMLHVAAHSHPRSLGHHLDEFPISRPEVQ